MREAARAEMALQGGQSTRRMLQKAGVETRARWWWRVARQEGDRRETWRPAHAARCEIVSKLPDRSFASEHYGEGIAPWGSSRALGRVHSMVCSARALLWAVGQRVPGRGVLDRDLIEKGMIIETLCYGDIRWGRFGNARTSNVVKFAESKIQGS